MAALAAVGVDEDGILTNEFSGSARTDRPGLLRCWTKRALGHGCCLG